MSIRYNALFRLKRHTQAISLITDLLSQRLFCASRRGRWYDDIARLMDCYGDKKEAKMKCKEALADVYVASSHRSSIEKRLKKLCKNSMPMCLRDIKPKHEIKSTTISGERVDYIKGRVHYNLNGKLKSPEQYALDHYKSLGFNGFHSENSIITTLFGLLFWDIIFDDNVPGVFSYPFQIKPLDLGSIYFYHARQELIEARVVDIVSGKAVEIITRVCDAEREKETRCIGSSHITKALIGGNFRQKMSVKLPNVLVLMRLRPSANCIVKHTGTTLEACLTYVYGIMRRRHLNWWRSRARMMYCRRSKGYGLMLWCRLASMLRLYTSDIVDLMDTSTGCDEFIK